MTCDRPSDAGREAFAASLEDAVAAWHAGAPLRAERHARAVLARDPSAIDAYHLLQEILTRTNRLPEATEVARCIVAMQPREAAARRRLADLLIRGGDLPMAADMLSQSLALEPCNARALCNLGHVLTRLGRIDAAVAALEQALALNQDYPAALVNLGLARVHAGELAAALTCYQRALMLDPQSTPAQLNLAALQLRLGDADAALAGFDHIVRVTPGLARAHAGRGAALEQLGQLAAAIDAYHEAARLDPGDPQVYLSSGQMMLRLGNGASALRAFDRLLALDPQQLTAREGRAKALIELGRHEDALPAFEELERRAPHLPYVAGYRFYAARCLCQWDDFAAQHAAIADRVRHGERAEVPLSFLAHSEDPEDQRLCAHAFVAAECVVASGELIRPMHAAEGRCAPPRGAHRRLRVGYLSSDFREHPVAQLFVGVIEAHDRARFETYGFCAAPDDGSALRRRIAAAFDHFEDVSALSDRMIAARIAALGIDVLLDLGGHTAGGRTRVLGHRPAAVQIAFLGFPGTLGAEFVDYIIADAQVIPEDERCHYDEKIICLPGSCLPAPPPPALPAAPSRREAGLPDAGIVLCCFNAPFKITPAVFSVWMRVLQTLPGAVLWLRDGAAGMRANLVREAGTRGVDPDRLRFAPRVASAADHLARLALADLFLDTSPYNAHSTAIDALTAGVPIITQRGRTFASRVATSLLHAVGLARLSVPDPAAYERLTLDLAQAPDDLAALKGHLRQARHTAELFDPRRFCRHLEHALLEAADRRP